MRPPAMPVSFNAMPHRSYSTASLRPTPNIHSLRPQESTLQRLRLSAYIQTFRSESLAFKLACIYLFIEYIRPQSIWPSIDVMPLGLLSLVGGVAVVVISPEDRAKPVYGSQLGLLLIFFAVAILSIILSDYPATGWANLPLLISWIFAYFLISKGVNNRNRFLFFYVLFLLFSFKMSQFAFRSWMSLGFHFNREGVPGSPGWFKNSGELGIQMCIFLPMLLHFANAGWKIWGRIARGLVAIAIITAIGAIVGSSSRGALIGSAAALLWMLFRSKYKLRMAIGIGLIACIVALILPAQFYYRLAAMGQDNSSATRLSYWAFGWDVLKQHPIFGIGYFNWMPVFSSHLLAIGDTRPAQVCHNIFVQAGSELGFVGLLLEFVLIAATFVLNYRTRTILGATAENAFFYQLSLGLDAGMVGYLVSAQFVTVLYYPYQWIALALTVALHNSVRQAMIGKSAAIRNQPRYAAG